LGKTENFNTAIEYLDQAAAVTPEKPQPYIWKGCCLTGLFKYNEAIACLTMALEWKPNTLIYEEKCISLGARATCYSALGMKDKADKDTAEAERLVKPPTTTGKDFNDIANAIMEMDFNEMHNYLNPIWEKDYLCGVSR
jgi:tetratricopeptide (TPR) repeat protein